MSEGKKKGMSGGYKNRPTARLHLSSACQLICHFNRRRARRFQPERSHNSSKHYANYGAVDKLRFRRSVDCTCWYHS